MYFPDFKYIPPSEYEPKDGLQARLDAFSGLCVTWGILYLHYRVLNPDIQPKRLIDYLDKKEKHLSVQVKQQAYRKNLPITVYQGRCFMSQV